MFNTDGNKTLCNKNTQDMAIVTNRGTSQIRATSSYGKMNTKCNYTHVNNINMTMTDFFVRLSDSKHRLLRLQIKYNCRSQWPRGLRRRSVAARLLRSWVRIPSGAWMFVCYECCVLSGRGLCDELITRLEESYRLWCVVVCDRETSRICAPYIYDIRSLRVKITAREDLKRPQ